MKKILTLIFALILNGCAVNQDLSNSVLLSPGLTKQEVVDIMGGPPIQSDFERDVEEWTYCNTGFSSDAMLALFFHKNKLIAKYNYRVSVSDIDPFGAGNNFDVSCAKYIRRGTYKVPQEVIDIRVKFVD